MWIMLSIGVLQFENRNNKILKQLYEDFENENHQKLISELDNYIIKFEKKKNYKLTEDQKKIAIDYLHSKKENYKQNDG